jgi:hypothetical protein
MKMRKFAAVAAVALLVGGCYVEEYPTGQRVGGPDPEGDLGKIRSERRVMAPWDIDRHYREGMVHDLGRPQGKATVYTPEELAEYVASVTGMPLSPDSEIAQGYVPGQTLGVQLGLGPLEREMVFPVLANAFNMSSPNLMMLEYAVPVPWTAQYQLRVQPSGEYIVLPAPDAGEGSAE